MKKNLLTIGVVLTVLFTQAQTNLTTAVDFTVTDVHGNTHNLFNYLDDGKHVIVDFFFTTCGPCISSVPTLNQAYTDYGCNTGEVIFLSVDDWGSDAQVLQYENDYGGLLPAVSGNDGGGGAVNQIGPHCPPHHKVCAALRRPRFSESVDCVRVYDVLSVCFVVASVGG